jgi:crotonobetainyl-CoA:carnitine CoA-transferase CaiB-like acyl-CoA transferase
MSGTPVRYHRAPPLLGEHTDAILAELRATPEEIRKLRAQRAV